MSFQVRIGSLGGTVFFQVGLCAPLQTVPAAVHIPLHTRFFISNQAAKGITLKMV